MKSNIKFEQNINKLLKILVCPKTGGKLKYDKKTYIIDIYNFCECKSLCTKERTKINSKAFR